MRGNYKEIVEMLRSHGLQVTSQRVLIYDYLKHTTEHPTALQIFRDVVRELPGISKATVYNILELFTSHGLVRKITPQAGITRYDGNMEIHAHLVCTQCQQMVDFYDEGLHDPPIPKAVWGGFEVTRTCVIYYGVCETCREKMRMEGQSSKGEHVVPLKRKASR